MNNDLVFRIQNIYQRPRETPSNLKPVEHIVKQEGIELHQQAKSVLLGSFTMAILGMPGAGKSTLIQHFLNEVQFYAGRFQRVLFIGPSRFNRIIIDEGNGCKQINMKWIQDQIRQCNVWRCKSMLIVFDDVVASMKSQSSKFTDLFFNRRHLLTHGTVSILITSQKWHLMPTQIRSVLNGLVLFPQTKRQVEAICSGVNHPYSKKIFMGMIQNLQSHEFLYLNLQTKKAYNTKWQEL